MGFERLLADFGDATGIDLSLDSQGSAWCEADGVVVTLQHRPEIAEKFLARKDELIGALNKEFNTNENVELGHGRKVVESLYGILVGDDGRKTGE